ncbi:MAG TPA: serpin family protein [Gemmatimonadales bacterium]|nr:serpin family protein [Gemmatimonadales bacterium]
MSPPLRWTSLLMMTVSACGQGSSPTDPEPLIEELPRPLTQVETGIIDAGNRFTFDLFREAVQTLPPDSNAFLSPFSAAMALGMATNGAAGATLTAMQDALRTEGMPLAEVNQAYRGLLDLYTSIDRTTEFLVGNSVWVDQGFPVRPEFLASAHDFFQAEARSLDLQTEGLAAINGWVREKTRDKIPTLLEQIDSDEIAFLINAIYFKGRWRIPFDPKRTTPQSFTSAGGVSHDVPTMTMDEKVRVASRPGFAAADLLYGNGAFAMTILLPDEGTSPASLLATLSPESWRELEASYHEARIVLSLPKFKLEYRRSLVEDLKALGMGIAFDNTQADFTGIANVSPERLYLTQVLQKAFVEVNEEGTEAAAATAVGVGVTSMPPAMIVNRPFLFTIRERLSGTILFLGQVNELP